MDLYRNKVITFKIQIMKKALFTLFAMFLNIATYAQWSSDPSENSRITAVDQVIYGSNFEVNKDEVTYVYTSGPNGDVGGHIITFLQIIDKKGNKLFPDEGKIISKERTRLGNNVNQWIMADNQGNALITVSDCRNSPSDSKDLSYSMYKVSPTGEFLWGDKGVDLEQGHCNLQASKMTMIQLEDNSYVFAWIKMDGVSSRVQMERLSVDGEFLWENSIVIEDDANDISWPYLVNALDNQFILIYSKGSNQEIMARKFDFDGSPVWTEDTRVCTVGSGGPGSVPLWTYLNVLTDQDGGVFVGWYASQGMTSEKIYVSHVKSDGQLSFPGGELGLQVGNHPMNKSFDPDMYYNKSEGSLFVIWRETDPFTQTAQRLMMQKISMAGDLEWGDEGLPIVPLQEKLSIGYYSIQESGDGGFIAFYMTMDPIKKHVLGYAAKIEGKDGTFAWENEILTFSASNNNKGGLKSSPLIGNTHWLTMWTDYREGGRAGEGRVFMQRINVDASLGNPSSIHTIDAEQELLQVLSLPGGEINFKLINNKAGINELSIYSLSGQKMAVLESGYSNVGIREINWDAKAQVGAGIYLATYVTSDGNCKSVRVAVK